MDKQTKTILGLLLLGGIGYYLWKKSKENTETTEETGTNSTATSGCVSYNVVNNNPTTLDDDGGVVDYSSVVHYVTCDGEPNDTDVSTNSPIHLSNVKEGSVVSEDTKITITKI